MDAALEAAGAQGCHLVWLETLLGSMARAIAVYRRHGFRESTDPRGTLAVDGVLVMERRVGAARLQCA